MLAITPFVALWSATVVPVPVQFGMAAAALVILVVPVTVVALSMSTASAPKWALERGARLGGPGARQLSGHPTPTRVARTVGVVGGFSVNLILMAHYNADPDRFRWFADTWHYASAGIWMFGLGYVLGPAWAEFTKPHDRTSPAAGAAVLTPRRVNDFLDLGVRRLLIVFALFASLCTVWWIVSPPFNGPAAPQPFVRDVIGWVALPAVIVGYASLGIWMACGTRLVFRSRRIDALRTAAA